MSVARRYGRRPWSRRVTSPTMSAMNYNKETTVVSLLNAIKMSPYFKSYGRNGLDNVYVDCDEVYPNIFIGDGTTAKNKSYLKKIGITHVLNTAEGNRLSMVDTSKEFYHDTPFKYLGLPLLDLPTTRISVYFNETSDFIEDAIKNNGKVYVHCFMGMSRSSTCVIAYLMIKRGMDAVDAIRFIRQRRDIYPNEGFLQQLADLDNYLRRQKEKKLNLMMLP